MRGKGRTFLKALCKLVIQALAVLAGVLAALWLFAHIIFLGGPRLL